MNLWLMLVDATRALLFSVAHITGGSFGAAILVVSTIVRLALLPLTLRLARQARAHQAKLQRIAPELERLRKRHANDQAKLAEATLALHREHGIGLMPPGAFKGLLIQAPVYSALYRAITTSAKKIGGFLWIRDLTAPDVAVATVAALLAAAAGKADASNANASRFAIVSGAITLWFAWRLTAGVGLYWVASNVVGLGQAVILRTEKQRS